MEQRKHHSVMGKTGDPADGAAVASTIFAAVVVYGVRQVPPVLPVSPSAADMIHSTGFPYLLRTASLFTCSE